MVQHWGLNCLKRGVLDVGGEPGWLAAALISRGISVTVVDPCWGITGKELSKHTDRTDHWIGSCICEGSPREEHWSNDCSPRPSGAQIRVFKQNFDAQFLAPGRILFGENTHDGVVGQVVNLEMSEEASVKDVKAQLAHVEGLDAPMPQQLSDLKLSSSSILTLVLVREPVELKVHTMRGKLLSFQLDPCATVDQLQEKLDETGEDYFEASMHYC
eukprot:g32706.t1